MWMRLTFNLILIAVFLPRHPIGRYLLPRASAIRCHGRGAAQFAGADGDGARDSQLYQRSDQDFLTDLVNRRRSFERLEREMAEARIKNHDLSIVIFDIDSSSASTIRSDTTTATSSCAIPYCACANYCGAPIAPHASAARSSSSSCARHASMRRPRSPKRCARRSPVSPTRPSVRSARALASPSGTRRKMCGV